MKRNYTLRVILLITFLTAAIIGMSLFTQQLMWKDSKKLEAAINSIENHMQSGSWKNAEAGLGEVEKTWSRIKGTWSALIDHQEIDNIDVTLSRLQMLIKSKELPSSLSEAAALKKYIDHIPAKEKPYIENLL